MRVLYRIEWIDLHIVIAPCRTERLVLMKIAERYWSKALAILIGMTNIISIIYINWAGTVC